MVMFGAILNTVESIHKNDIAHLDLSLENFLIAEDESVKLCDFGVAVHRCEQIPNGFLPGKPMYLALEIALGRPFDPFKADMYSLGIILFCLLYGFQPYRQPDPSDPVYLAILSGSVSNALELLGVKGMVSVEAEDLLCGLLSFEPTRLDLQQVQEHAWLCRINSPN